MHDYNLALSLQFYTMFDTLFEGHRCVIVENKKRKVLLFIFKFLSTGVGDWCVFWVSLDVSCFEHKCGFGSAVVGCLTCIGLQHMGC